MKQINSLGLQVKGVLLSRRQTWKLTGLGTMVWNLSFVHSMCLVWPAWPCCEDLGSHPGQAVQLVEASSCARAAFLLLSGTVVCL